MSMSRALPFMPPYLTTYCFRGGSDLVLLSLATQETFRACGATASQRTRPYSSSKPMKTAASSTDLRFETTALAGKLSSGQPMAMQIMMTWSSGKPGWKPRPSLSSGGRRPRCKLSCWERWTSFPL